ncbi:hypothetical protein ACFC5X_12150 [Streptomyces sp. NPDC055952]|uniref:hypothetical protein n=1 Tax=Streptomyces sp. NPDC055952 TaxID=3345663 RepID=UPI0035DAE1F9
MDTVVEHVCRELTGLLGLRVRRFGYGTLLGRPPRLTENGRVTLGRRSWDVETDGRPDGEIELRACGNGYYLGRFMPPPRPRSGARAPGPARGGDAGRPDGFGAGHGWTRRAGLTLTPGRRS